jgi:VanZ family protein
VSQFRLFLKYWLPVLAWMTLIFSGSGDSHSAAHSSRIIVPLMRWLFPDITQEHLDLVVLLVRKCAHLTEYAVLAWLFWRAVRQPLKHDARPWSGRLAVGAILFVALYAASDEWHQTFVPSREGCVRDVVIDTTGAVLGMFGLWVWFRWRQWRRAVTVRAVGATGRGSA